MNDGLRLLDSSVVIRHFRHAGSITARLEALARLYVSGIALGELYSGAHRSARPAENLAQIEAFLPGVIVLPADEETAEHYGRVSAHLAAQGTPIPHNDMWIAATALQWGLTVATTDAHYSRIPDLNFEMW